MPDTSRTTPRTRIPTRTSVLALVLAIGHWWAVGKASSNDIVVDSLEGLYAAVNGPTSNDAFIRLRPSTYVLTPTDPSGQPRPNGGSLFLKAGMTLQGNNEYVDHDSDGVFDARDASGVVFADPLTETIIDGGSLNLVSQGIVSGAIVVEGPLEVAIRNLTVRGGPRGQAAVEIRAPGSGVSRATIQECIIERGRRGIFIDAAARWLSADTDVHIRAERNVIRDHRVDHLVPGVVFGWGIHAQLINTDRARLSLAVNGNRFTRNKVGLFLEFSGTRDSEINAVSQDNVYEDAVLTQVAPVGNVFTAGIFVTVRGDNNQFGNETSRNRLNLLSRGDRIWNNVGWAGLYLEGTRRVASNVEMAHNRLAVELLETEFVKFNAAGVLDGPQNQEARSLAGLATPLRRDVVIVGANNSNNNNVWAPPEGFSGTTFGNQVSLLMRHTRSSCIPTANDPAPQPLMILDNSPGGVDIHLLGGSPALDKTNTGWNCPN